MSVGAAIGSVAAPVVGGLIGNELARGDDRLARQMQEQALREFLRINVPSVQEQELILQEYQQTGRLSPELEQAIVQQDSEMRNVSTDPRLRQAQMAALEQLQGIGQEGGLNAQARQRMAQVESEVSRQEAAQRGALMQDFARRGQMGSGMEMAAALQNQQAAAERASQRGMDLRAQAEQQALQALMQAGQLGGQMQSQEFNQAAAAAEAQDAINRFNATNRQQVQGRNVASQNDAQRYNLDQRQRIADANVGLRNEQQAHNKGLLQTRFDNQLRRASGLAGQYGAVANQAQTRADQTRGMWSGIGQGVGQGFASYAQNQPKKKEG